MVKFTEEQQAIIEAPRGNLLVSAAAGSGKTAVMTERIVRRLADGQADIRHLLVLTFTKNAAGNMRDKIEEKLSAAVAAATAAGADGAADLESQLYYLPQAAISTVHSFCNRLLINFSDLLKEGDLPPLASILLSPPDQGAGFSVARAAEPAASSNRPQNDRPLLKNRPAQMDEQDYKAELSAVFEQVAAEQLERLEELEGLEEPKEEGQLFEATTAEGEFDRYPAKVPGHEAERRELAAFRDCLNLYFNGRLAPPTSNRATGSLIGAAMELYHNLRSLPDYPDYLARLYAALCAGAADFSKASAGRECLSALTDLFNRYRSFEPELRRLLDDPEAALIKKNWSDRKALILEILERLNELSDSFLQADPTAQRQLLASQGDTLPAMPPLRSSQRDSAPKARLTYLLRAIVGELLFVIKGDCATATFTCYYRYDYLPAALLPTSSAADLGTEEERLRYQEPFVRAFFNFILRVDRRFATRRYERGLLHFSDLEQLALLLVRKDAVKAYCRDLYREIYVDEFQDTNDIQMAILDAIADHNLFVVGDLKQSIYRFRYAKPEIFASLYNAYQTGSRPGAVFELHRNFRSHGKILRGVNRVFKELMVGDLTQIQYADGHAFEVSMTAAEEEDSRPRLYLTSWPKDQAFLPAAWPDLAPRAVRYIPKLRQLAAEGYAWGDLCILVKTNQEIKELTEVLTFFNIPYSRSEREFRPDRYEQELMASLVYFLNNPLQDIPLLTVMTSPLLAAPFTEAELFHLKQWSQAYRQQPANLEAGDEPDFSRVEGYGFWQHVWTLLTAPQEALAAVLPSANWTSALYDKLIAFKAFTERSRRHLSGGHLSEGLRFVLMEAAFIDRLLTLPDGRERVDRVHSFLRSVAAFEAAGRRDLADLAAVLVRENGLPEVKATEAAAGENENAVHLLTIHGSKGLEFPVVILGDFDLVGRDREVAFQFSETYGVGADCNYIDRSFALQVPTVTRTLIKQEERVALFAESLRLLYVAMTRAEAELHVVTAELEEDRENANAAVLLNLAGADSSGPDVMGGAVGSSDGAVESEPTAFFKDWHLLKGKKAAQLIQAALAAAGGGVWPPAAELTSAGGAPADGAVLVKLSQEGQPGELLLQRSTAPAGGDWLLERYCLAETESAFSEVESAASKAEQISPPVTKKQSLVEPVSSEEQTLIAAPAVAKYFSRLHLDQMATDLPTSASGTRVSRAEEESLYQPSRFPLKLTVSEVKRQMQADLALSSVDATEERPGELPVWPDPAGRVEPFWRGVNLEVHSLKEILNPTASPNLLAGGPELGQLLHRAFQLMDWELCRDTKGAQINLQNMLAARQLQEAEYRVLQTFIPAFVSFGESDLNERILAAEQRSGFTVYRELPFTLALPLSDLVGLVEPLPAQATEDRVMVQGIIDLWFMEDDGAVLLDYKSDYLMGADEEVLQTLKDRYAGQLDLYRRAIAAASGRPVKAGLIWSIRRSKAYRLF